MCGGCGEAMRGSECHGRGFEFDPGSLQRMGPEFCLHIELSMFMENGTICIRDSQGHESIA